MRREGVQVGMKAHLGLLSAVLLLTGCAAKDQEPDVVPGASAQSSATSSAPKPEATVSRPTKIPKNTKSEPPVDAFQQVVTSGQVRIKGQCVELVTDQLTWVLIGPDAAKLRDGTRAKVTGVPDPNRETGCTGSPLLLSKADPE